MTEVTVGGQPISQADFPGVWSCMSESKDVKVELQIPTQGGYAWIEIPTTQVRMFEEKGEAARIQRTAEVKFPTQWGDNRDNLYTNSPRQLIQEATQTDRRPSSLRGSEDSPWIFARVHFRDGDGNWVLSHFGWVGGVGSIDEMESRLWIYDVAEMLSSVPISESFNHPTIRQAAERLARMTNDNTPIPISEVLLVPPESEDEWEVTAENFREVSTAEVGHTSPFYGTEEARVGATPTQVGDNYDALVLETGLDIPFTEVGTKQFQANEHVLLDIFEWVEQRSGLKFHFEPADDSVILVFDIKRSRRTFKDVAVANREIENEGESTFHEVVDVLHNNALYEIVPTNTVHLRGDVAEGLLDPLGDRVEDTVYGFLGQSPPSEKFPVVKVQAPGLIQAAGGKELAPSVVESDATSLDAAENEAIDELTSILEETSQGSITMRGAPRLLPNDKLVAFEVCGDHVEYEQDPIEYEVESVEHICKAGEPYKTEVSVSIWANDDTIETVEKRMVEL